MVKDVLVSDFDDLSLESKKTAVRKFIEFFSFGKENISSNVAEDIFRNESHNFIALERNGKLLSFSLYKLFNENSRINCRLDFVWGESGLGSRVSQNFFEKHGLTPSLFLLQKIHDKHKVTHFSGNFFRDSIALFNLLKRKKAVKNLFKQNDFREYEVTEKFKSLKKTLKPKHLM